MKNLSDEKQKAEALFKKIENCAVECENAKLLLEIMIESLENIQNSIIRLKDKNLFPGHYEYENIDKNYQRAQELGYIASNIIGNTPDTLYDICESIDF